MTTIEAVSAYLPSQVIPIDRCLAEEGLDRQRIEFHRKVFGNRTIRREPGMSATELLLAAASGLPGLPGYADRVRYLVYARTIAVGPYQRNPLRDLRDKLGLSRAMTFSVSQQACASGLLAVDVCGKLLAEDGDPDALALVVAGEKAFSPITRLMGPAVLAEGAAAVLVAADGAGDPLLGWATRTHSEFNDALGTPPDLQARFNELSPECLVDVVSTALDRAGLTPSDIAVILPHNINLTGWQKLARRLRLPEERLFLDNLTSLGHSFCADSFLNYRGALDQGRLRHGDHYVMTALGAGATWSAMVFRYCGGPAVTDSSHLASTTTAPSREGFR